MDKNFHENRSVGLILTFIGGMVDSYTYIRYKAFASAQTGNLILAIIQSYNHQWSIFWKKILSTIFFFMGILLAKFLIDYFKRKKIHYWRLFLLYFETLLFFVISLPYIQPYPSIITIIISFISAIQWISFDKINGITYTNLFTTGNLKGVAVNLYDYLTTKDQSAKNLYIHFGSVAIAFITGAIMSVLLYKIFEIRTMLIISGLFLYLAIYETFLVLRFQKSTNINKKK